MFSCTLNDTPVSQHKIISLWDVHIFTCIMCYIHLFLKNKYCCFLEIYQEFFPKVSQSTKEISFYTLNKTFLLKELCLC